MRPLNLPGWISVCAAVGALVVACGGGGGIGPRGTGSAGLRASVTDPGEGGADGSAGSGGWGRGGRGGSVILVPTGEGGGSSRGGAGGMGRGGAGAIGHGGAGEIGQGGTGGADLCDLLEHPYSCPPSLCGNGVIDTCVLRWRWGDECYEDRLSEACDGTDLGGMTCETVGGFPGGTLRCSSCSLDTSGCSECVPDSAILRCDVVPIVGEPAVFAMAASDQEVGLVGIAYSVSGTPEMSFTRVSSKLEGLSATPIQDPALEGPNRYDEVVSPAVASRPSGWVIAGTFGGELFLHAVDAQGQGAGRATVEEVHDGTPYLVPRGGGGPLLVWAAVDDASFVRVRAAVIGDDGISTTAPVELTVPNEALISIGRGTFLDDVFYVPMVMTTGEAPKLRIARISATGALISVTDALPDSWTYDPALVAGDGELHLTFNGVIPTQEYGCFWQALDKAGAPASHPVLLGQPAGPGPTVAMGNDTFQILFNSYPDAFDLVGVTGDGAVIDEPQRIAQSTHLRAYAIEAVTLGPDLIVAWQKEGDPRLRMARVRP